MKANFVALVLSLCILSPATQASVIPPQPTPQKQAIPLVSAPVINKININIADVHTLTGSFRGIGKKRAEAIIAYRESHQGFKSIEELAEVKGLGQHFVEVNREKLNEVYAIK